MRVQDELILYTDGACSGTTGGYGCVLVNPINKKYIPFADGPYKLTTNNQMEMLAVIRGLSMVFKKMGPRRLLILSDSKYVINGATEWIHNWKKNGWFTADNKPVKNGDFWRAIDAQRARHHMTRFQWVRGHNGNEFNEMADTLAVSKRSILSNMKKVEL